MEDIGYLNLGIDFTFLILWVIDIVFDCFFFVVNALEPYGGGKALLLKQSADTSHAGVIKYQYHY